MHFWAEGLIIASMLFVNGVFASYEMALASVSRARLEALRQAGRRGAAAAAYMKERLEGSLAVVQLGITLAGAVAAATGGVSVDEYLSPAVGRALGLSSEVADFIALACFVIPLSALTIIFAELIPKMVGINHGERVVLALSPVMKGVSRVFGPAVFVFESVVKGIMRLGRRTVGSLPAEERVGLLELRAAAALARTSRVIGPLEERIVVAAAQLSARPVREAMLPAYDIDMIPHDASLSEALIEAHLHMHTRYPTCTEAGNPQTITGYVNFKDIMAALKISPSDPRLRSIVRPLERIDAGVPLSQALDRMIRGRYHIALVVDAGGAVLGLLSLEDIVEELVGDIGDEYDRLPMHFHALAAAWIVGGGVTMGAVRTVTGLPSGGDAADARVLADWCRDASAGPLADGAMIRADGLEVMIRKMRRRRVMEAVVRVQPPGAGAHGAASVRAARATGA